MNLFSRVHMPIGLGIGAREPAEIAVSILAELVAVRRGMPEESLGSMRLDAAKISEPLPREQEAESEAQSVPS